MVFGVCVYCTGITKLKNSNDLFLLVYAGSLVTTIFKLYILENGYWVSNKEKTDCRILTAHLEKVMGVSCSKNTDAILLLGYIHEVLSVTYGNYLMSLA